MEIKIEKGIPMPSKTRIGLYKDIIDRLVEEGEGSSVKIKKGMVAGLTATARRNGLKTSYRRLGGNGEDYRIWYIGKLADESVDERPKEVNVQLEDMGRDELGFDRVSMEFSGVNQDGGDA